MNVPHILIMIVGYNLHPAAITTAEFGTKQSCVLAAHTFLRSARSMSRIVVARAQCVRKDHR